MGQSAYLEEVSPEIRSWLALSASGNGRFPSSSWLGLARKGGPLWQAAANHSAPAWPTLSQSQNGPIRTGASGRFHGRCQGPGYLLPLHIHIRPDAKRGRNKCRTRERTRPCRLASPLTLDPLTLAERQALRAGAGKDNQVEVCGPYRFFT